MSYLFNVIPIQWYDNSQIGWREKKNKMMARVQSSTLHSMDKVYEVNQYQESHLCCLCQEGVIVKTRTAHQQE